MENLEEIKKIFNNLNNLLKTILSVQQEILLTIQKEQLLTIDSLKKIANTLTYICNRIS